MVSVLSLLTVLIVSLVIVRVATVALTLTGLSQHLARFQARSAFTGAGFTTAESEKVVQHPLRRRIIMLLMLLGNAGLVTAVSSLLLSFVRTGEGGVTTQLWFRLLVLSLGLAAVWTIAHSKWIDRRMSQLIAWALERFTQLEVRDYAGLLHLSGGYAVVEMEVQADDWLAERELKQLRLSEEGVLVLGVERPDGTYVGAPRGRTVLRAGDVVLLYGPSSRLNDLDERRADSEGNWQHHRAVDSQRRLERQEQAEQDAAVEKPGKSFADER